MEGRERSAALLPPEGSLTALGQPACKGGGTSCPGDSSASLTRLRTQEQPLSSASYISAAAVVGVVR